MLKDRYEFQYQLDHLFSCCLRLFFSLDEFNMFFFLGLSSLSLGLAHPLIWFSFAWCFGICSLIIFSHCTRITGSVPYFLLDPWFNFRLDAHIFTTERWKTRFYIHTFFERVALITLPFFSLMELELKVDSRICGYRWSTDLVIVCFSHLFYLGLLMEILWSHL